MTFEERKSLNEDMPFHDSVLEGASIDWDKKTVIIKLGTSESPTRDITVEARQWQQFDCPFERPWGESHYTFVNDMSFSQIDDSRFEEMKIELQTGDTIRIVAESIEVSIVIAEDQSGI